MPDNQGIGDGSSKRTVRNESKEQKNACILATGDGTADADFILSQNNNNDLNGFGGDDVLLGDMGNFIAPTSTDMTTNHSFETARDLDLSSFVWSVDENPLFGDDTIPHATVIDTAEAGQLAYYSIELVQGQQITIDFDAAAGSLGGDISTNTEVWIYNAGQVEVAYNNTGGVELGGEGSISAADAYLTYTIPTTGTYYIVVGEWHFIGDGTFEGGEQYMMNVSVTGHAVHTPDVQAADNIDGGPGDDLIMGVGGNDYMEGDGGNDRMLGGSGDDVMLGGLGADVMFGDSGLDEMYGNAGNDTMYGGSRVDELYGGSGNDSMFAGSGNDRMNGGSGNDLMFGGNDNDLLIGGPDDDNIVGGNGDDEIVGGTGIDTANFSGSGNAVDVNLIEGTATGEGNDTLASIENVIGSGQADTIRGDGVDNEIEGRGGSDTIFGNAGNDTISGGSLNDDIFGGVGHNTLMGDSGNDKLNGGSGNDWIEGGNDDDLLIGGPGDDFLTGGAGVDHMIGGSGDDTFFFQDGSGNDSIEGFMAGEGSVDVLDYSALGISFGDLNIAQQGSNTLIQTPNGDTVLLLDVLPNQLDPISDFNFNLPA
ncbi:calcium-binding protein [Sphingomicrobium clamense]|uniref:Calcium-binding protein n=1 Tax=Sphingomicrobium clamense TaxID=2851013 RepID=A0ABS6V3M7_9SPHN|nr:calcium-binding protein [Sphingomicrobium sp. B8]MBW0144148.1 hypothetical protein [Sphingomicrobium sp. B8]